MITSPLAFSFDLSLIFEPSTVVKAPPRATITVTEDDQRFNFTNDADVLDMAGFDGAWTWHFDATEDKIIAPYDVFMFPVTVDRAVAPRFVMINKIEEMGDPDLFDLPTDDDTFWYVFDDGSTFAIYEINDEDGVLDVGDMNLIAEFGRYMTGWDGVDSIPLSLDIFV